MLSIGCCCPCRRRCCCSYYCCFHVVIIVIVVTVVIVAVFVVVSLSLNFVPEKVFITVKYTQGDSSETSKSFILRAEVVF